MEDEIKEEFEEGPKISPKEIDALLNEINSQGGGGGSSLETETEAMEEFNYDLGGKQKVFKGVSKLEKINRLFSNFYKNTKGPPLIKKQKIKINPNLILIPEFLRQGYRLIYTPEYYAKYSLKIREFESKVSFLK